ncbi:MAG: metallophosphoesterase [Gemmatimonadaceae bacterium]
MPMTRRRFLARATAAATAAVAGGAGLAGANRLEVRHSGAPSAPGAPTGGVRVALLTDMHAPHDWFDFDELARAVADFEPDLLVVAGDAFNRRGDEGLVRAYERLDARAGKFAALGNWEYQSGCDLTRLAREYERAGVRLLVNAAARVDVDGGRIRVVGLDDLLRGRPRLAPLRAADARADRTLVLAHCPALFDDVAAALGPADAPHVVLSGHTHGGQIAPFGRALVTPIGSGRFVKGWYAAPDARHHLYVSRGLGNSDIPFRIGSRPELALLTI